MCKKFIKSVFILLVLGLVGSALADINYDYYEATAQFNALADVPWATPTRSGVAASVNAGGGNWVEDPSAGGHRADDFAFRFTGYIWCPVAGQYTFYIRSDDGSDLYIDAALVINNDGLHGAEGAPGDAGTVTLAAGAHAISVRMFERGGGNELWLNWLPPGAASWEPVPDVMLTTNPARAWNMRPADRAGLVSVDADLQWAAGTGATQHKVYFGTYQPPLYKATLPLATTTWDPGTLAYNTNYYWQIGEIDGVGGEVLSPVSMFRTQPDWSMVPDVNQLAYLKFDGDYVDSSGYGNHGAPVGAGVAIASDPQRGQVATFDGSSCVDLGANSDFNPAGSFSISVWANIQAWTATWGDVLVGKRGEDGQSWQLRRFGGNTTLSFTTRGVGADDTESITAPTLGEWYHIAAVYNNTANTKRIYLNGVEDVLQTTSAGRITACTHNVYVGARANANNTGREGFFRGKLDDVRIYKTALTKEQVAALAVANVATRPVPADGDPAFKATRSGSNAYAILDYKPGKGVVSHTAYFSLTKADVDSRNPAKSLGAPTAWPLLNNREYVVGYNDPAIPLFARTPLTSYNTTYYWCVDESDGTTTWPGKTWTFTVTAKISPSNTGDVEPAVAPGPEDGAVFVVGPDVPLTWLLNGPEPMIGYIVSYGVFWGTDEAAVAAEPNTAPHEVVQGTAGSPTPTTYTVTGLPYNTEIFWRIDTQLQQETPPHNKIIVDGTVWSFTTASTRVGTILREWWLGIAGTAITALTGNANYPDNPNGRDLRGIFESPTDWADNYGSRLHGWLLVQKTGDYTFWISTDDNGELWLSTDTDPANATRIAYEDGATGSRVWENGNERSVPIHLEGGKGYYISGLIKEEGGGDNIAVAWSGPDSGNVLEVIPGSHLVPYIPKATNPSPADGQVDLPLTGTMLSWTAGIDATTFTDYSAQRVYFGTDAAAVAAAGTGSPEYKGALTGTNSYGPVTLGYYKQYYWRIDGVSGTGTAVPGDVWEFKATYDPANVPDPNLRAWYKFDGDATDSSGYGRHGAENGGPTYEAGYVDYAIKLDGVDDWVGVEPVGISGAEPRTIAGWVKGGTNPLDQWLNVFGFTNATETALRSFDIEKRSGQTTYCMHVYGWEENIIDTDTEWHHLAGTYNGATVTWYADGSYIGQRAEAGINTLDQVHVGKRGEAWALTFNGMVDDVRIYDYALNDTEIGLIMRINLAWAWGPKPMDGATGVSRTPILTWKPGDYAPLMNGHYVSFGADDPANMVLVSGPQTPNNYTPSILDLGTTYYWAVDEVNTTLGGVDAGRIWMFTTIDNEVIDDMETYTPYNVADNNIFATWVDGAGDCGSVAGNNSGAILEVDTTYYLGGAKSMKYQYDNDGTVDNPCPGQENPITRLTYSKAEALVAQLPSGIGSDWTAGGAKALSLWFQSDPFISNSIEPMWVQLTDASNNKAKVFYGDYADEDVNDMNEASWHEWLIDLADFTGVNVSNVKSMAIGVGNETGAAGGSGTLYFDDIRLYTPRCILTRRPADYALYDYAPEGTPGGDCKVDYKELAVMARDWATGDRTVNPQAISVGPVASYQFENNATDSSGNGNNGTENGGPLYTTGKVGSWAISLDGVDDYVSTGKTASNLGINGNNPRTVTAWVYTTAFNNGGIFDVGTRVTGEDFSLRTLVDDSHLAADQWWRIQYWGGDYDFQYDALNKWVHFAHVHDGVGTKIYADGRLIVDWVKTLNTTDTNPFQVGRYGWPDSYFSGLIDDLKLYDYALTEGQVLTSAGLGSTYIPLTSPANVYDPEPKNQKKVNFKDYSKLVLMWLEENEWPLP